MRHHLAALAAVTIFATVAVQAETPAPTAAQPAVAAADTKMAAAQKTLNSSSGSVSKDPALKPLADAVYAARTKLEIALKRVDTEFVDIHAKFVEARDAHKADKANEALKKAYYAAQDAMVADLAKRAKGNDKVKAQYDAWIAATAAVEDKTLELLKAKNPTKAALYEEALMVVRAER